MPFTYMKPTTAADAVRAIAAAGRWSAFSGGRHDALRPDEAERRGACERHRCQFAHGAERLRYLRLERAGVRRAGADERRRGRPVAGSGNILRFRSRSGARRRNSFATWQASAATSSSAPDAPIFAAASRSPATSASPAAAARPGTARTVVTHCSAAARPASPFIPATGRSPSSPSMPRSTCSVPAARERSRSNDLHREPGATPDIETVLEPDELILRIRVPGTPLGRASTYHKIRDRESYRLRSGLGGRGRADGWRHGARRAHRPRRSCDPSMARPRGRADIGWPAADRRRRRAPRAMPRCEVPRPATTTASGSSSAPAPWPTP